MRTYSTSATFSLIARVRIVQLRSVLIADEAALKFAYEHDEELFGGMPVIFLGINDEDLANKASKKSNMTGSIENYSFDKTIDVAIKLLPERANIVTVIDNTKMGTRMGMKMGTIKEFRGFEPNYPGHSFEELDVSLLNYDEICMQLQATRRQRYHHLSRRLP